MYIGIGTVELQIYEAGSLKEKRAVLRSLVSRLRNLGSLSVAEVGFQDTWQRALLGLAVVASSRQAAETSLRQAAAVIEREARVELLRFEEEIEVYDT